MKNRLLHWLLGTLICCFPYEVASAQTSSGKWLSDPTTGVKVWDTVQSLNIEISWEGPSMDGWAHGMGKLTRKYGQQIISEFEGEFIKGIKEGKGCELFTDGRLIMGEYENGLPDGNALAIADGEKYEGGFFRGKRYGAGKCWQKDGSSFEGLFKDNKPYTGKFLDAKGNARFVQAMEPAKRYEVPDVANAPALGVQLKDYFDENKQPCKEKNARYYRQIIFAKNNKPLGPVRFFYMNGVLESETNYPFYFYAETGISCREGKSSAYYADGSMRQTGNYKNDLPDSNWKYYYANQVVSMDINFKNGVPDSTVIEYYPNGKIRNYSFFRNGLLEENRFAEFNEKGAGSLKYMENFRLNKKIWELRSDAITSIVNDSVQLEVHLKKDDPVIRTDSVFVDQHFDYSIESDLRSMTGKAGEVLGLIFGFKNWDNYLEFLISTDGGYIIYGKNEGEDFQLTDWGYLPVIHKGIASNHLKVERADGEFLFYINGSLVDAKRAIELQGSQYGFMFGGKGKYLVENLVIKQFLPKKILNEKRRPPVVTNIK